MKVRKSGLMIIVEINGVKFYYGIIPKEDGYLAPDSFKEMTEGDFERSKKDTEKYGYRTSYDQCGDKMIREKTLAWIEKMELEIQNNGGKVNLISEFDMRRLRGNIIEDYHSSASV